MSTGTCWRLFLNSKFYATDDNIWGKGDVDPFILHFGTDGDEWTASPPGRLNPRGTKKVIKTCVSMPRRRRDVEVYLHSFLTSALDGGEWSVSRPGRFTHQERNQGSGVEKISCTYWNSNHDSLTMIFV